MSQSIAITGLNGYIATWVALHFLERDWTVVGSVRSESRVSEVSALPVLEKWFENGKLKLVIVDDLVKGDFTELFNGVNAVIHLAAPIKVSGKTWAEVRDPSVVGTQNLMEQAAKVPSIKAVSIVSSLAAVWTPAAGWGEQAGRVYNESSYFPMPEKALEELDPKGAFTWVMYYSGAKKLLEDEANATYERIKPSYTLSLVAPPMVYGPAITMTGPQDKADIAPSVAPTVGMIAGKDADLPMLPSTSYVDPRDLSEAFYRLITQEKSGRWIIANPESYDWHQVSETMRRIRPQYAEFIPVPKDKGPLEETGSWTLDVTKSIKELGLEYTSPEKTWGDVLDYFAEIGLTKAQV